MFKLTIGKGGCVVSDFEQSRYCFYSFNAETEVFDIEDSNNGLVRFMMEANPSDNTLQDAVNAIYSICKEELYERAIEATLGMHHVTFPAIDEKGALMCYCENIVCVVLSVVRYLAVNKYKFSLCAHCEKPYCVRISQKTSATKYCKRNSPCVLTPHLKYTHLPCEQAVRNIRQQLSRMKERYYNSLYNSLDFSRTGGNNVTDFLIECDSFGGITVDAFIKYYEFLKRKLQERGLA